MGVVMKASDRAYFAGLIDGEGSISLVRSFAARTRGRYLYPLVRIANTDRRMIDWIQNRVLIGSRRYQSAANSKCRDVYHLSWASGDAIKILKLALPYLVVKKDRAILVLELHSFVAREKEKAGGYFGRGHPISETVVIARNNAFKRMHQLNARGTNHATKQ
jgi:hypothetical protein